MTPQPLPTVIGPTENALRALLTATLNESSIGEYVHWVALNAASREDRPTNWRGDVANSLKVSADVVDAAVDDLCAWGLVEDAGDLTARGHQQLTLARGAVRSLTAQVVAGISESDLQTADRVLRAVQGNAERLLAAKPG